MSKHNCGGGGDAASRGIATPVSQEQTGSTPDASSTAHDELMAAARAADAKISKGENGRKRKASVERYMYQFMHGQGTTVSRAFKDGWERTFGKKQATLDVGNGMVATGDAANAIATSGEPKSYAGGNKSCE